jgi:hypothetical protein
MLKEDHDVFRFDVPRRRFTDDALLANLRAFGDAFPPHARTAANYRAWESRRFHDHTIIKQLGGWLEALRRAGLEYAVREATGPTQVQVEADVRRFAKVTPVAERTWANFCSWPIRRVSAHAVKRRFGPWHTALTTLGIEVPGRSRSVKHSDEELLEAIWRVWRWCGRPPSALDFRKYGAIHTDGISYPAVYYRFGPVRPFLFAFAEWKQGRMSKRDLLLFGHKERARREPLPPGLRHKVLQAAGSTCAMCGRSRANTRGLVVHVDHITPVSKGGTNDASNLQVLCAECNLGKGPHGRPGGRVLDTGKPKRRTRTP